MTSYGAASGEVAALVHRIKGCKDYCALYVCTLQTRPWAAAKKKWLEKQQEKQHTTTPACGSAPSKSNNIELWTSKVGL